MKSRLACCFVGALWMVTWPAHAQERVVMGTAAAVTAVISQVGITQGLFKENGLDADLKRLPGGNDTIQGLLGGALEFAESSNAQFLAAVAKGLPVVGIALHSYGYLGKLIAAPRNASLKTLQDFKGKRIGVQAGSGVYTVLLMALERQGLKASDFVLSNIRVNDMPAAMMSDTFDAVLAWEPQAGRIVDMGRGKEVISAQRFEELADVTYPLVVMTSAKLIKDRPDFVQAYVNAFAKAQRFIHTHPAETMKIYRTLLPPDTAATVSDAEVRRQILEVIHYDHVVPSERDLNDLRRTGDFLLKEGAITARPDLEKSIDMRFARNAAAQIK